ncbi:ferredoxin [Streptomyces sp. NBRC 109706]|uniref:ferredoxin n=1 Tax=Streptomyces sp. NBRC 109706 TaxID=1550035 RepID=UPI000781438F|nr:ferredoxin [Streptomyces sp. NBRC 109706]
MSDPRWHTEVDRGRCVGSGMCVSMAPTHFRLDQGRARTLRDDATAPDESIVDVAESCPAEAITVRDAASGRLVAPQDV